MKQLIQIETKTKACFSCKHPISSYLEDATYSFVCDKCGAICDNYHSKSKSNIDKINVSKEPLLISIGSEGILAGTKYKVISHTRKKENGTTDQWSEFGLFNPVKGQAFLTVDNGHWTLHTLCKGIPSNLSKTASWNKQSYKLYAKYKSKVVYASGEFTSKFEYNKITNVEEYIFPPFMLTKEYDENSLKWFEGVYIMPDEIKKAFNLNSVPSRKGVGQIQPYVSKFSAAFFRKVLYVIALIWGGLQFYYASISKEEIIYSNSYLINDSLNKTDIYTPTFELSNGTKNMELRVSTNIDNNWMYNSVTLVNEKTGDVFDFDFETEYYYGYEGGENWTEGSNWNSRIASSVPEGTYYMIIQPQKPDDLNTVFIEVFLRRDVFVLSNGIIVLLLLAAFPTYYFYFKENFEKKRWYNSSFYPFNT